MAGELKINLELTDGVPMASSLDIAEKFGKRHKNVLQAIEGLEMPEDFSGLNFQPTSYLDTQNKERPMTNMTRDGFTLLAMGFTGKAAMLWKVAYMSAFNAMEVELRARAAFDPVVALNDPDVLRGLLSNYTGKVIALESTLKLQAPKIAALDLLENGSEGSLCVTNAAKSLQMRPKKFFEWLSQRKFIYRRPGGGSWVGYQGQIQRGFLEHKITTISREDGSEKITSQVLITAKGLAKIAERLVDEGLVVDQEVCAIGCEGTA